MNIDLEYCYSLKGLQKAKISNSSSFYIEALGSKLGVGFKVGTLNPKPLDP